MGVDPLGNIYEAEDTAEVRVIDPAISPDQDGQRRRWCRPAPPSTTSSSDQRRQQPARRPTTCWPRSPWRTSPTRRRRPARHRAWSRRTAATRTTCSTGDPLETWHYECSGDHRGAHDQPRGRRRHSAVTRRSGTAVPVVDFAAAHRRGLPPGDRGRKTADPTALLGGGEVTYTYEVRTPATCRCRTSPRGSLTTPVRRSPIVSGDEDGDGLLDTPPASSRTRSTRPGSSPANVRRRGHHQRGHRDRHTDRPRRRAALQVAAAVRVPGDPCDVTGTDTASSTSSRRAASRSSSRPSPTPRWSSVSPSAMKLRLDRRSVANVRFAPARRLHGAGERL